MKQTSKLSQTPFPVWVTPPPLHVLTVSFDTEAEGRLQFADVILDDEVQAVDSGRGEGVVQPQGVLIQHG